MKTTTYTLPGLTGAQTMDYAYSSNSGKLETITFPASYPSGYRQQEKYGYQNGILQRVFDPANTATVWWLANTRNFRNQITTETLADGALPEPQIQSTRTYDAASGWLKTIVTGISGMPSLQTAAYIYDVMGNMTQRQDYVNSQTENLNYDSLYQLTQSVVGTTTTDIHYDGMGNITSRDDIAGGATWTYDPTYKHRVNTAGDASHVYNYDMNGNVNKRNGSTITWASYNYPVSVATSTEAATFDYGPNRQRWHMAYNGPAGVENTYYVGSMFEVVGNSSGSVYKHYIYADGRAVAVILRNSSGAVSAETLLTDHQGSVSAIVPDSAGTTLVGESFTPFGNRRSATNWTAPPTSSDRTLMDSVTRQGYTFQTVLGSMGMNHMNGRVEDAVTGRFLSLDPHVTEPADTQAWNPYSYVRNNPLLFVDPTGFDTFCQPSSEGDNADNAPQPIPCKPADPDYNFHPGDQGNITVQCTICCGTGSGCWAVQLPNVTFQTPFFATIVPLLSAAELELRRKVRLLH